jgi:site-specific DNA-cytosine methylase
MKYISLFTGIGGLESALSAPILCCELDKQCREVLRRRFGTSVTLHPDLPPLNSTTSRERIWGWSKPREATNATRKEGTG